MSSETNNSMVYKPLSRVQLFWVWVIGFAVQRLGLNHARYACKAAIISAEGRT